MNIIVNDINISNENKTKSMIKSKDIICNKCGEK